MAKDRDDSIAAIPRHYHMYNAGGMVLHHHYVGGWLDIAEEVGEAGPKVYGVYYRGAILFINLDRVTAYEHRPTSRDGLFKHPQRGDVGCAHGQDQDHSQFTSFYGISRKSVQLFSEGSNEGSDACESDTKKQDTASNEDSNASESDTTKQDRASNEDSNPSSRVEEPDAHPS